MFDIFGILMTTCFVLCYVPQIIKIAETKSVGDISPLMYIIAALGNLFAVSYGLGPGGKIWLVIESAACFSLICVILGLWNRYK